MLGYAIYDDNLEEVRKHLETGINFNERIQSVDNQGTEIFRTPLDLVWRNLEMINLFIQYGANVTTDQDFVFEIIHNTAIADQFINDLDLNKRNESGETPLYDAMRISEYYNHSPVKWLLKHQVDVNVQNIDGDTPLHIAVERKN